MPQSLTRLPKEAHIQILGHSIIIQNHRVVSNGGLLNSIMSITSMMRTCVNEQTLSDLEKHGISFEMAIECCVREIEKDSHVLVWLIWWHYKINMASGSIIHRQWERVHVFSNGAAGRKIAEQHIEKIRSCENWQQLYQEMDPDSQFSRDMQDRISEGLEE